MKIKIFLLVLFVLSTPYAYGSYRYYQESKRLASLRTKLQYLQQLASISSISPSESVGAPKRKKCVRFADQTDRLSSRSSTFNSCTNRSSRRNCGKYDRYGNHQREESTYGECDQYPDQYSDQYSDQQEHQYEYGDEGHTVGLDLDSIPMFTPRSALLKSV